METRPPELIERIAGLLIPPACREQVLGDLAERFTSTGQYLADLASLLPYVIASRIRRNWDPNQALIEGFAAFVSYVGALYWLQADRAGMIQWIGFAMALTLALLALVDAYARPNATVPAVRVLIACSFCVLILVWALPAYAGTWALGGLTCTALIAGHRTLLPPRSVAALAGGMQLSGAEDLLQRIQRFETRVRRRNAREYVAAAAVIVFFSNFLTQLITPALRVACMLIIAGALWNIVHLRRRGRARSIPNAPTRQALIDFYRSELARQRDLLKNVMAWALVPMLPGLLTFLGANLAAHPRAWAAMLPLAAISALVFVLIWSANRHAAFELEQEIHRLD